MENYTVEQIRGVLRNKGYLFFDDAQQSPYNLNIIAVRSSSRDVNMFNDKMFCIYRAEKSGVFLNDVFQVTTKPGKYYLENPIRGTKGTGILVPNQYRNVYSIGRFLGSYDALIQVKPMRVYRDGDRDDEFDYDPSTIEEGDFGICVHRASLWSISVNVNNWSAGCQVHSDAKAFDRFMNTCKKAATRWGNKFTYTLLEEADFH